MASARGVPPGSRVQTTSTPRDLSHSATHARLVDLPTPSLPSRVVKRPRCCITTPLMFNRAPLPPNGYGYNDSRRYYVRATYARNDAYHLPARQRTAVHPAEIGRASCRERGSTQGVGAE